MNLAGISFIRLEENHVFKSFDCDNKDLNDFLLNSAKPHQERLITVTYLLEDSSKTVAFFSLLNDKITLEECSSKSQWRKLFKDIMPKGKRYDSYPAMKIGRLGVDKNIQRNGIGKTIIDYIKVWFIEKNKTGCRLITVDAIKESIPFYLKNGFIFLTHEDEKDDSRQMYFDLTILKKIIDR